MVEAQQVTDAIRARFARFKTDLEPVAPKLGDALKLLGADAVSILAVLLDTGEISMSSITVAHATWKNLDDDQTEELCRSHGI